jgi:hypothetical protein
MPKKISDFEFRQQASLSQKVSFDIPLIQKLAGSDVDISDSIAVLSYINDPESFKKSGIDFILGLLNVLRLARFATSEKTNEISKMGFMLPAKDVSYYDE